MKSTGYQTLSGMHAYMLWSDAQQQQSSQAMIEC